MSFLRLNNLENAHKGNNVKFEASRSCVSFIRASEQQFENAPQLSHLQRMFLVLAGALFSLAVLCVFANTAFASPLLDEYQGDTRYDTAALEAQAAFPDGVTSGYGVLVCGENNGWADALSASSLAGMLDAPVLLTNTAELPDTTSNLISDLGIDHVIIVGGSAAVSEDVEASVNECVSTVERVSGQNRQETQSAVYRYGKEKGTWDDQIIVASCSNFADALSVSPIAYSKHMPIFLVSSNGSFTDNQVVDLYESGCTNALIVGGTAAVSEKTEGFMTAVTMINALSSADSNNSEVKRISGSSRYDTSMEIAQWAVNSGYANWDNVAFASGETPADALAGSALQGKDNSVILLVDGTWSSTISGIANHAGDVYSTVRVFGGTAAVSEDVRSAICDAVGAPNPYHKDNDCAIMGSPEVSVSQMVDTFNATGHSYPSYELGEGGASSIWDFCNILYEEACWEGVKPEVVFAQSMHETGWLQFGGDVSVWQYNFAGIGATGGGAEGNWFENVRIGLRAQIQHLKAYACTDGLNNDCVDPRFNYVSRGCAPTVQSLGGKWAVPGTYYGDALMTIINQIKSH